MRRLAIAALVVLAVQIALGGWTSSNYAAVACPDFPRCQGQWWPEADFGRAFVLWHGLGIDYEGGILDHPARIAIHLVHRIGAVIVAGVIAALGLFTLAWARDRRLRAWGLALLLTLLLQLVIGITMVVTGFPLPMATAHNFGAALLLLAILGTLRSLCATTGD